MKVAIITGAGGFIGSHLVKRLKKEGYWVRGIDLKYPEFSETKADDFVICDLRKQIEIEEKKVFEMPFKPDIFEVYALAGCMGGTGFIFTGGNDADIIYTNALINLNTVNESIKYGIKKIFFSSSVCVYSGYKQMSLNDSISSENSIYLAIPDNEYGWEKLFSEHLYLAYNKNYGVDVKIARFHNIFGTEDTWQGGREKAPAVFCRKIIEANPKEIIEILGDGNQTRSFLYIDECIKGIRKLMDSDFVGHLDIGSKETVTINHLVKYIMDISGKELKIKHVKNLIKNKNRSSDNKLIKEKLGWEPSFSLKKGLRITYNWIENQIKKKNKF